MRVMFLCLTVFMAAVATAQTAPDSAAIEELQNGKSLKNLVKHTPSSYYKRTWIPRFPENKWAL